MTFWSIICFFFIILNKKYCCFWFMKTFFTQIWYFPLLSGKEIFAIGVYLKIRGILWIHGNFFLWNLLPLSYVKRIKSWRDRQTETEREKSKSLFKLCKNKWTHAECNCIKQGWKSSVNEMLLTEKKTGRYWHAWMLSAKNAERMEYKKLEMA